MRRALDTLYDGCAARDALGNLICRVGKGGTKIMIAAHMDAIGMMVAVAATLSFIFWRRRWLK